MKLSFTRLEDMGFEVKIVDDGVELHNKRSSPLPITPDIFASRGLSVAQIEGIITSVYIEVERAQVSNCLEP